MACDLFKPRLAALVYDDLSAEDRTAVEAHLASCPACAAALERLGATRAILAEAAPDVPQAPRLVVIQRRRPVPGWASFAAGVAAAAIVGAAGFLAGSRGATAPAVAAAPAAPFDVEQARAIAREESRRQMEAARAAWPAPAAADALTRTDLRAELDGFERRLQRERAQDVGYVLDQIAASESRSRDRIVETQKGLRYVALASNPGLGEY